ncbi:dipeptide/oligopeptide/nickel ABC transporter ATP-binding protein [Spirochaetia bacterium]|nr:dipeptide/oligopeptide/nickel ABC transporter ATP-binding protein [Spirochaetia bacterium]
MEQDTALLSVRGLKTYFHISGKILKAVDDVSFNVKRGETFGIVGESGCGKSIASLSIMRLVNTPPGRYEGGEILFEGRDILKMEKSEIRTVRGAEISIIFQEPMTALNPVFTVGYQLKEVILLHQKVKRKTAAALALDWLKKVEISNPEQVLKSYPFTLSGGMRQRVMIAMALACRPKLLIADEPTTALDVTIQAQILELLRIIKRKTGIACIFITHDLSVMSSIADRVMVMYSGRVCEIAPTVELLIRPLHPYTRLLINSRPSGKGVNKRLTAIPGNVPSLHDLPPGCPFHPRCPDAHPRCAVDFPPMYDDGRGHSVYCWNYCGGENHD